MDLRDFPSTPAGKVVRNPRGYWTFVPNPLPPVINWTPGLISTVASAEGNLGKLDSLANSQPSSQMLIQSFMRREAVLSSRIEGTQASMSDVYFYEATQLS
jgi:cell filamentation protein, protein adenylyltransferase